MIKNTWYILIGCLFIGFIGGYLFLKSEFDNLKIKLNRIEAENINKQLAEEKIRIEEEKDKQVKDIDGNIYKIVKIGRQYWTAQNLNVSRFNNGDKIPVARSQEDWERALENGQPACCCLSNAGLNCEKFGRLYNWYAITDPRGLTPKGFYIPNENDWKNLNYFIGSYSGQKLKSKECWEYSEIGNGTDDVGFSVLPGGFRCGGEKNIWGFINGTASFWGVDKIYFNEAWFPPDKESSFLNLTLYIRYLMIDSGNNGGASVRCLKSN